MVICGLKITHDGGIAVIHDGRLVFSIEAEKLGNADRHENLADLDRALDLLRAYGYRLQDVDRVCIDGWAPTDRTIKWNDFDVPVKLAPYRRGLVSRAPLQEYSYSIADLEYSSYPHYTGHLLAGYCLSPFAKRGEDSFVLTWDGGMFPYLYFVDRAANAIKPIGVLFNLIGKAYEVIAHKYRPFDGAMDARALFAIPGKVMAYVARGQVKEEIVSDFGLLYHEACDATLRSREELNDEEYTHQLGGRVLQAIAQKLPSATYSHEDALASWQAFLERLLLTSLRSGFERVPANGRKNLILVGGSALNIKWNRAIRDSGLCDAVWIPPIPNDSGAAIGAACCGWVAKQGLTAIEWSVYSGPALGNGDVDPAWTATPCSIPELARVLHETDEPVVFLNGRAELGPRALGARSILASARHASMKDRLNAIKLRENYRPVAPICLEHRAREIFDPGERDPYMLFEQSVRAEWQSKVRAICHEDGTARLQTIRSDDNPKLFELLTEYERISGVPVLCNTSANLPGKGFFPDVASAVAWGKVPRVWANGTLYSRPTEEQLSLR